MQRLSLILVAAFAIASPPHGMAAKNTDAIVAGVLIGALIAGAAEMAPPNRIWLIPWSLSTR